MEKQCFILGHKFECYDNIFKSKGTEINFDIDHWMVVSISCLSHVKYTSQASSDFKHQAIIQTPKAPHPSPCNPHFLDSKAPVTQVGARHSPSNFTLCTDKAMGTICYNVLDHTSSTPCPCCPISWTPHILASFGDAPFPSCDLARSAHLLSSLSSMMGFKLLSKMDILWVLRSHLSYFLLSFSNNTAVFFV